MFFHSLFQKIFFEILKLAIRFFLQNCCEPSVWLGNTIDWTNEMIVDRFIYNDCLYSAVLLKYGRVCHFAWPCATDLLALNLMLFVVGHSTTICPCKMAQRLLHLPAQHQNLQNCRRNTIPKKKPSMDVRDRVRSRVALSSSSSSSRHSAAISR